MEIKPLINTQIEINKQWTALALMLRNNAMPKLVYNRNKFPKGWDPDATSIGVTGDVKGRADRRCRLDADPDRGNWHYVNNDGRAQECSGSE